MEHTPGPWKYVTRIQRGTYSQPVKGNPVRHYVTGPRPSQNFAEPLICHLGPTYDRAEADARLIAAAPELLAALKRAVSEVTVECEKACGLMADEKYKWVRPARELIAKAEGE